MRVYSITDGETEGRGSLTSAAEIDVFRSVTEVSLPIQTKISASQSNI